jgi:hypothetical protein
MGVVFFMGYLLYLTDERLAMRSRNALTSSSSSSYRGLFQQSQEHGLVSDQVREWPPSREEVGRSVWMLLHSAATNYDDQPTVERQRQAREMVEGIIGLYPCYECGAHFREVVMERWPLVVSSRRAFSRWTCEVHNMVNERLKKDRFDCAKMDEYYLGLREDDDKTGTAAAATATQ